MAKGISSRVVLDPHPPAPELLCPTCDQQLLFKVAIFGGVQPIERWDHYDCRTCGAFEYRHRTRQLRRATG